MSYVPRQIKPEIDTVNNNKLMTDTKALVIRRIEEKNIRHLYIFLYPAHDPTQSQ